MKLATDNCCLINFSIREKIELSPQFRYLGVTLQDDLHWNKDLTSLEKKLTDSIALLSKIRHYVLERLLRTIYYSMLNSHLIYVCKIWGQN